MGVFLLSSGYIIPEIRYLRLDTVASAVVGVRLVVVSAYFFHSEYFVSSGISVTFQMIFCNHRDLLPVLPTSCLTIKNGTACLTLAPFFEAVLIFFVIKLRVSSLSVAFLLQLNKEYIYKRGSAPGDSFQL